MNRRSFLNRAIPFSFLTLGAIAFLPSGRSTQKHLIVSIKIPAWKGVDQYLSESPLWIDTEALEKRIADLKEKSAIEISAAQYDHSTNCYKVTYSFSNDVDRSSFMNFLRHECKVNRRLRTELGYNVNYTLG